MSRSLGSRCGIALAFGLGCGLVAAELPNDDMLISFLGALVQYTPDGRLVQTYNGTGNFYLGASLTPEGRIVTTRRVPIGGVVIFEADGTEAVSFDTPEVPGYPGDVSVFSDGVLAVSDGEGDVDLYTQAGVHLATYTVPGFWQPFGSFIDSHQNLWVADARAGYIDSGAIYKLARDGSLLDSFDLDWHPGDLIVAPDGSLWVSDIENFRVVHLAASGAFIDSFEVGHLGSSFYGLDMDSQEELWVVGRPNLVRYTQDGHLLALYTHTAPFPNFMTVVKLCGDGFLRQVEQCDDRNNVSCDGCSSACEIEHFTCGNGVIEHACEECDDGNTVGGDGCTANCRILRSRWSP